MENNQVFLLRERIRQRPAMFIGAVGATGLRNLIIGLSDMACANLPVDTLTLSITIGENQLVEIRFSAQSGNSDLYQKLVGASLTAHDDQIAAAAAAALSVGYVLALEDNSIKITFQPDSLIFADAHVDYFGLLDLLREQSLRYPGVSIRLSGFYRGCLQQNEFAVPGGLREDFSEYLQALPKPFPVVSFDGVVGGLRLQICAAWRGDWYPQPEARIIAGNQHYGIHEAMFNGTLAALRAACKSRALSEPRAGWRYKDAELQRGLVLAAAVGRAVPEPDIRDLDPVEISKILKPLLTRALEANPEATRTFMTRFNDKLRVDAIMEKFATAKKDL